MDRRDLGRQDRWVTGAGQWRKRRSMQLTEALERDWEGNETREARKSDDDCGRIRPISPEAEDGAT